jgi:hypothetical protein
MAKNDRRWNKRKITSGFGIGFLGGSIMALFRLPRLNVIRGVRRIKHRLPGGNRANESPRNENN